jgi:hypothetical protein
MERDGDLMVVAWVVHRSFFCETDIGDYQMYKFRSQLMELASC